MQGSLILCLLLGVDGAGGRSEAVLKDLLARRRQNGEPLGETLRELQALRALLLEVNYGNRLMGSYRSIIAERRFEPAGFPMRLGRKDVGLALAAAGDAELPLTALIAGRRAQGAWLGP